jgi:hypothetical protein
MTLHLRRPSLPMLRASLAVAAPAHDHEQQPLTERLRGGALRAMRRRVLARSGGLCECPTCRAALPRPITWATFHLDHVVRVNDGGSNAMDNLRAVHVDCHARITAMQNAQVSLYGCVLPEPEVRGRPALQQLDPDDMPC